MRDAARRSRPRPRPRRRPPPSVAPRQVSVSPLPRLAVSASLGTPLPCSMLGTVVRWSRGPVRRRGGSLLEPRQQTHATRDGCDLLQQDVRPLVDDFGLAATRPLQGRCAQVKGRTAEPWCGEQQCVLIPPHAHGPQCGRATLSSLCELDGCVDPDALKQLQYELLQRQARICVLKGGEIHHWKIA